MVKFKVTNQFWDTATKKMIKADSVIEVSEKVAENLIKQNLGHIAENEEVIILSEPIEEVKIVEESTEIEPEVLSEPIEPKRKNKNRK